MNHHRHRSRPWVLTVVLMVAAAPTPAAAVEPWADDRLTERDGLAVWLDASRQPKAAAALSRHAPKHDAPLDTWFDGSGNRRHLNQLNASARPAFVQPAEPANRPASVRFDGKDDALLFQTRTVTELPKLTLVLVASPRVAPADFPAMLSAAAPGQNDYTSGLNVDLGPWGSARFDTINVEGAGMSGMGNLLAGHPSVTGFAFGSFHTIATTIGDGPGGVAMRVDGKPSGRRDRAAGTRVRLDQLVLGARLYSNEGLPPYVQGFFDGEIAEVLLYDRVLDAEQLARVEKYLDEKYASVRTTEAVEPPPPGARPLVSVESPPAVQMFVPGFATRKLPLDLTNINNLRYRADGKLVALAYDGNVYLLSDTDNDGLEDRADLFWDNKGRIQSPIGMALTPPGYAQGDGLFIASKGKLSLVVDKDKDDKADEEIVVATGWPLSFHQVDALGVAVDPKDQSVYFGIGTWNFADPLQKDKQGVAHYDPKSERGTILRVAPDFSKREIVCTGIRFPVALAFNSSGDLFCTDQEGATWVPNGNPFDELLHIQPGRHYGFPARHSKWVPDVIDEPSVFDYKPQHQSTCGLTFNEPVNGGPVFGPASWRGDAIVTGYSRGKLYRTKLVKTAAGYVAQNHLFASMTSMPADACVSPAGDLVVAAHGGLPDWGTGPAGKGELFKIAYVDRDKDRPQPLLAYSAGPHEVRIAYDRPLDLASLKGLSERASIEFGEAVAAGDRFEKLRPGYEIVKRQMLAHRFGVDVAGVAVTPDRRTIVVQTAQMSRPLDYAITLPTNSSEATDLAFDLTGVHTTWTPGDGKGKPQWTGWLPHVDLAVAHALTAGSAEHDALRDLMKRPGVLRLSTQLDLTNMLRPAVQPGSALDYEPTPETVTIGIKGSAGVTAQSNDSTHLEFPAGATLVTVESPTQWLSLTLTVDTGKPDAAAPAVSFHTKEDPRPRAFALRRMLLPWAKRESTDASSIATTPAEPAPIPELAGGNWARGRAVFNSEQAMCAKCHRLHDDGLASKIGPDLSNLHHRDYASVLQDVVTPSVAINPDHVAYAITLNDGTQLAGVPRSDGDATIIVGEPGGQETRVERKNVKSMEALSTSIMPHGIDQTIGKDKLRDLMTFLLAPPLEPAQIEIPNPPPPRTRAEVEAVLGATLPPRGAGVPPASSGKKKNAAETPAPRELKILLAAGPKDHGPGEHDYPLWQKRWTQLLTRAENVTVDTSFGWPEQKQFDAADVIVFFSNNPGWSKDKAPQLDAYLKRGGGLVYLHYAVDGHADPDILGARIGLAWRGGASKFRHGALDLTFPDGAHPITRGIEKASFVDESYWQLIGDASRIHVLATGPEDGSPRPLMWTHTPHGPEAGRVFVNILGHYNWTFDDPIFRVILLRGIVWCGRDADVDRLTPLATAGARLAASVDPR